MLRFAIAYLFLIVLIKASYAWSYRVPLSRNTSGTSSIITSSVHTHSAVTTRAKSISLPRRDAFFLLTNTILSTAAVISFPSYSMAQVTDETKSYAVKNSVYDQPSATNTTNTIESITTNAPTDEITIRIPISKLQNVPLGIELADVEFRTNRRVSLKSIQANSIAAQYNVPPNTILVSINGQSTERTNARGVVQMISNIIQKQLNTTTIEDQDLVLVLRNNTFQTQLQNLSPNSSSATTQIAPAGDTTQRNLDGSIRVGVETQQSDQRMTVSQLIPARYCTRGARLDDLLEISYTGSILEEDGTTRMFDGSAVKINGQGIPGRGNDVSVFFVLGKQPFGQFPPSWDVGLEGICVGERRRLVIPPVLAYGAQGLPRRGIPPNATLVYDVTLVSLNGLATPQ